MAVKKKQSFLPPDSIPAKMLADLAKWGTQADIEPYVDTDNPTNNIILTNTEGLTMNSRPSNPKYARNKNTLIIGGSGSGKTRFFMKPNLMPTKKRNY